MILKRSLPVVVMGTMLASTAAMAQRTVTYSYPATYPFVYKQKQDIYNDVKRVTEDPQFVRNFKQMRERGLFDAKTKQKPWTASYWPLSKGTIADPYENSAFGYYVDIKWVNWKGNYNNFQDRLEDELADPYSLSEEELAKLAPSEKYDLLLGDLDFDLTSRLWEYMKKWGSEKENAFITNLVLEGEDSLDLANDYIARNWYSNVDDAFSNSWNLKTTLSAQKALQLVANGQYSNAEDAFSTALSWAEQEADNYVLASKNGRIAGWEGICNGWSTAAGVVPRPRKAIEIKLQNGKNLKFYPSDIKGLVSLYYVNSLIQDMAQIGDNGMPSTQGVVSAGLRCNLSSADVDLWGRPYDSEDDPFYGRMGRRRDSRCSGVHPATWHMGLVNIIGVQGRSFVVERKVSEEVDNHPMYSYEMKLFNPNSGRSKDDFRDNIERIDEDDQFQRFRHPEAKYIVGVENKFIYMNYKKPNRDETNSEEDDSEVEKKVYYDLELDADFNIVGGQWRAYKTGEAPCRDDSCRKRDKGRATMPDFFWTITKDFKSTGWFGDRKDVEQWNDLSTAPPRSWKEVAKGYHSFNYQMTVQYGNAPSCTMFDQRTGEPRKVICEQSYNRPQPMINVINALVELAK